MIPNSWAMAMTLSWPTLVARRTNAQFTEPDVADQRSSRCHRRARSWWTPPRELRGTEHGLVPFTMSFGRVAVGQRGGERDHLQRGTGLAPDGWVAMLYWLSAKSWPETIALTAPVPGSIATSDDTQSGPLGLPGLAFVGRVDRHQPAVAGSNVV